MNDFLLYSTTIYSIYVSNKCDSSCCRISLYLVCVGGISTVVVADLVPRSKRPRGAQGWCARPGVEAEMNAACQQREEARRHLRAEPHNSNLRKAVKMAGKTFGRCAKLPC